MKNIIIKIWLLLILSCFTYNNLFAQKSKTDSLIFELQKAKEDSTKVLFLYNISNELIDQNTDSALNYASSGVELAKKIDFKKGLANCYCALGKIYKEQGEYKIAMEYNQKSLNLYSEMDNKRGVIDALSNIGAINLYSDNYNLSIKNYQNALELSKAIKDSVRISQAYHGIGWVFYHEANYPMALEFYQKSLNIKEKLNNKYEICKTLNNIGVVHLYQKNYEQAIEYYQNSLKLALEIKHSSYTANCYNNLAIIYYEQNNWILAEKFYLKALDIYLKQYYKIGISASYSNLGLLYTKTGDYKKAKEFHNKALNIRLKLGNKYDISSIHNNIAKLHNQIAESNKQIELQKNNYLIAIQHAEKAALISREIGALIKENGAYFELITAYKGLKDYKKAFKYQELYISTKDSLFNTEKMKEVESMEAKYQAEKKQFEIENLEKENELKTVKLEKMHIRQILSYLIIFISVFIIISLITIRYKLRKKNTTIFEQNEEILAQNDELETHRNHLEKIVDERTSELRLAKEKAEESDRLKSSFLANMSHEIRTPMNAIVGFSSLITDPEIPIKQRNEISNQINQNSDNLLHLIDDIIDLSKIESNQLIIKKIEFPVNEIINKILPVYQEKKLKLKKEHIKCIVKNNIDNIIIYTDPCRLQQILTNLIDNAFKFTEEGKIEIGYKLIKNKKNSSIIFSVKDTGIGMSEEQQEYIFKRFSKIEDDKKKLYRGAGLGLAISKNLVELLGGKIWVESKKGEGSTFYFTIHT